jgi:hypothetical protein
MSEAGTAEERIKYKIKYKIDSERTSGGRADELTSLLRAYESTSLVPLAPGSSSPCSKFSTARSGDSVGRLQQHPCGARSDLLRLRRIIDNGANYDIDNRVIKRL